MTQCKTSQYACRNSTDPLESDVRLLMHHVRRKGLAWPMGPYSLSRQRHILSGVLIKATSNRGEMQDRAADVDGARCLAVCVHQ